MKEIAFNGQWTRSIHDPQQPIVFPGVGTVAWVDLPDDFIVDLPRNENAPAGAFNGFFSGGQASYTKRFPSEEEWKGKTVFLNLDGAYMNTQVTLNGNLIAMHPYGYTPLVVDLTPWLRQNGKDNMLQITTQSWSPPRAGTREVEFTARYPSGLEANVISTRAISLSPRQRLKPARQSSKPA